MKKKMIFMVILIVFSAGNSLVADIVLKSDGTKMKCEVISFDGRTFRIKTEQGKMETLPLGFAKALRFESEVPVYVKLRRGSKKMVLKLIKDSKLFYVEGEDKKSMPLMQIRYFSYADTSVIMNISDTEPFQMRDYLPSGYIVMFAFTVSLNAASNRFMPDIEKIAYDNEDVLLRVIDICDWDNSPVKKQYNVKSVPLIWVFDKNGEKVGTSTGDYYSVLSSVKQARQNEF